ncbi:MAG: helix-turn-helix transcriptional regulator [Clostridia bacterium]|nr:helix-turn-helix transcriptional regulator [Clostridia bacterium]
MIYSVVCEHIRELRIQRHMTQTELANMLGVSKSVISAYENGIHLPPYDILVHISGIFGVSCDYLLGVAGTPSISTEGLTDLQIQALLRIADELRQINSAGPNH